MTDKPTDRQIDWQVKARWLEIRLAQADLAELLNAAFQLKSNDGKQPAIVDARRLTRVAQALDVAADVPRGHDEATVPDKAGRIPRRNPQSQASLQQLRLIRAFCALSDHRAQRMLVYLAEQLVKRQATRRGDAG